MRLIPIHEHHEANGKHVLPAHVNLPSVTSEPGTALTGAPGQASIASAGRLRGIARVPTHTVGHARERRSYVRASLSLPLRVRSVAGRVETELAALSTQDISSSGIFFLCPRRLDPGTPFEMEVTLVDNSTGRGVVRMRTQACVVRAESAATPGWHAVAAAFDDITFVRDEPIPTE